MRWLQIPLCIFFGFIGSLFTREISVKAGASTVIRASRFELIGASGKVLAILGSNQHSRAELTFFDRDGKDRVRFGFVLGSLPGLELLGADDTARATLILGDGDKPTLRFGDERTSTRMLLGFDQGDVFPSNEDNWHLSFRGPTRSDPTLGLGVTKNGSKEPRTASIWINNPDKVWRVPER